MTNYGVIVGRFQVAYLHQDHYGNGIAFDQLETVFLNGELTRFQNLDEIRKNVEIV